MVFGTVYHISDIIERKKMMEEKTKKFEQIQTTDLEKIIGGKRHSGYYRNGYGTAHNLRAGLNLYNIGKALWKTYEIIR